MRSRWAGVLIAVACTAIIVAALRPAAVAASPKWGADYFPNIALTTQDGEAVHFYDLIKGKIVAIDLIYTTCQYACPLETARLAQVQKMLGDRVGDDVLFLSITIDPDHDTPAVLKEYADRYHVGPGWLFLTGKLADIDLLSKKLGLYSEPNPDNKDGHTPTLLIGNETTGQWIPGSALDNPRFTAILIGDFISNWKNSNKAPVQKTYDQAQALRTPGRGEYLFATKCTTCHTIGKGERIGPDLAGIGNIRERAWLARYISTPEKLLADGDPIAQALLKKYQIRMPNLSLTEAEGAAIADYVEQVTAERAAAKSDPKSK
jgi:protein SCO1/2